jgi:Glycosyltransferases involved in cell wall biogenesis
MGEFEVITVNDRECAAAICIVVVAYNRIAPLARLLSSLHRAEYDGEQIDLTISIDGSSNSDELVRQCLKFVWAHGRYTIRRFVQNQGLRRHVLACGDLSKEYDAVVVLEDDLVVSTQFSRFAKAAIDFYSADQQVAGISLYAPKYNEMANLPFEPAPGKHSVYALQSAQSWGQVWTRSMWLAFRSWYDGRGEHLEAATDMPARIYSWPDTSWKKFAMKFLAESGKTWIYPYLSHSSNFSELGSHNRVPTALYQTPLDDVSRDYTFGRVDDLVCYDLFFERNADQLELHLGSSEEPIVVDLYGTRMKTQGPCQLITRRRLDYQPVETYGLALRPHEASVVNRCSGDVIARYRVGAGECIKLDDFPLRDVVPFHSNLEWRHALQFGFNGFGQAVKRRLCI